MASCVLTLNGQPIDGNDLLIAAHAIALYSLNAGTLLALISNEDVSHALWHVGRVP